MINGLFSKKFWFYKIGCRVNLSIHKSISRHFKAIKGRKSDRWTIPEVKKSKVKQVKKKEDIRQDCVLSIYTKRIVDISIELVYNKEAESKK